MKNTNKFDPKEFLLGAVFALASFFLLGIFRIESILITGLNLNEISNKQMFDLATPKIITLSVLVVTTITYVYYLKKSAIK